MRRTPVVAAITATAALFTVSGCTSAASTSTAPVIIGISPSPSATPSATASPTPAPVVTVTVTAKPKPKPVFTTMEAAAKHLYTAWEAKDTTAAAQGATPAAVSALFGKAWKSGKYFFGGCDGSTGCQYNFDTGTIQMAISGNATSGYTVTAVTFGSAS